MRTATASSKNELRGNVPLAPGFWINWGKPLTVAGLLLLVQRVSGL